MELLNRAKRFIALSAIFVAGLVFGAGGMGYYAHGRYLNNEAMSETRLGGYKFIQPLVECDPADETEVSLIKKGAEEIVASIRKAGVANHVSVYFRALNDGHSFAINPTDEFIPASLFKVPIMINILRVAEENPSFLERAVTVPTTLVVDKWQAFPPREFLEAGRTYTVEELLRRMIAYSDNTSAYMLTTLLPKDASSRLYDALGIGLHDHGGRGDWVSVEAYASFFRVLYNATYLNREMSEKALSLLVQADIPQGMVHLAPEGVKVAKKFGHFSRSGESDTQQLHLCGIVYHSKNPYLVCVMTQGDDIGKLSAAISEVWAGLYRLADEHGATYSAL